MRDLEIYIRDLESSAVSSWLASHLDDIELRDDPLGDRAVKGSAHYRAHRVRINLYPGAGGKRYTSVILEGEDLPGRPTSIAPECLACHGYRDSLQPR